MIACVSILFDIGGDVLYVYGHHPSSTEARSYVKMKRLKRSQ